MSDEQTANVAKMREQIDAALAHEGETRSMHEIVRRAYAKAKPDLAGEALEDRCSKVVASVQAYVENTVQVIEQTIAAAEREGVAERVAPIFETAMSYLDERVDFIPDELGLAGLVDDAYLIHGLMQELSSRHRTLTGSPLLPESAFRETQRIRRMIGEPTATRLDVAIVAFARRQNVRQTIEHVVDRVGSTGLSMSLPAQAAFPTDDEPIDELPDLELGALGI